MELASGDVAVLSVTNVQNREVSNLPELERQELGRRLALMQGQFEYGEFEQSMEDNATVTEVN